MNCTFNFSLYISCSTFGFRIISTVNFCYLTGIFIFNNICTFNDICVPQTNFFIRSKTEKFPWRIFHKIIPVDIKNLRKRHFPFAHCFIFRIIDSLQFFNFIFRIIVNNKFNGINNCHYSLGFFI